MSTRISTHQPARTDLAGLETEALPAHPARTGRGWAAAGIAAGLAGIGTVVSTSMVTAVSDPATGGRTEAITALMATQVGPMLAFHLLSVTGALTMIVFAAGLHRRLQRRMADSTVPLVAFAGLVGTAVVTVLGSGLDTEYIWGLGMGAIGADPTAVFYGHWIATIPWVWVLTGLTGLALFAAARAGALPRWIGRVGLVLGGLTMLLGISPLQYLAGMTGPVWLLVTAVGLTVGDRAAR